MLLLDEIGLAEHSPHNPLKVLHKLLENPMISFVGLSNWSLGLLYFFNPILCFDACWAHIHKHNTDKDASKMNRANFHMCPELSLEDLKNSTKQIIYQFFQSKEKLKIDTLECALEKLR